MENHIGYIYICLKALFEWMIFRIPAGGYARPVARRRMDMMMAWCQNTATGGNEGMVEKTRVGEG